MFTAYYWVRRSARMPGLLNEERVSLDLPPSDQEEQSDYLEWQPVGTFAADAIRRWWGLKRRGPSPKAEAVAFFRLLIRDFWNGSVSTATANTMAQRYSHRVVFMPPEMNRQGKRAKTTLKFYIPDAFVGLLYLSALFGLTTGRLRLCRVCEEPFVARSSNHWRCQSCHQEGQEKRTYTGTLSPKLYREYRRLQVRLDQQVSRQKRMPEERRQLLGKAASELRLVSKRMLDLEEWRRCWDEHTSLRRKTSR